MYADAWRLEASQLTHDLCDTSAAPLPTELSSQLGAGHLWVCNIPVDWEGMKWI